MTSIIPTTSINAYIYMAIKFKVGLIKNNNQQLT